jgi:HEAT repeat protein
MAVEALVHIHAEPGLVLPVLTKSLQDSDIGVRLYAVNSLAAFRSDAEPAVPALTQLLKDPLGVIRTYAAKSLMKIDSQAAAKAGWRMLVLESLGDANPGIRFSAANGLGDFGAEVRDAVPALVRLLGDPEWIVRQAATNALKQIDPVAAAKAGVK